MSSADETPKLEDVTLGLNVTKAPSHSTHHADLDVIRWREILSHQTVLATGTIPKDAERGYTLFHFSVSPNSLVSQSTKSLLKHLSECFQQWNGTIVFELTVTIPSFVASKMVIAFVPSPTNPLQLDPTVLAGLQNSNICQASNSHRVELRVPFISEGNWLSVTAKTGTLIAKLLEAPVYGMDFAPGLPWVLMVRADPTDFNFRYITPPPQPNLPSTSGPTTSGGDPTMSDNVAAASYSTRGSNVKTRGRATKNYPLVRLPNPNTALEYQSMMLIPRARVEFVMQKVRGQYPSSSPDEASTAVLRMFDASTPTLSNVECLEPPSLETLFPYLCNGFVWRSMNSSKSSNDSEAAITQWRDNSSVPLCVWSYRQDSEYRIGKVFVWLPQGVYENAWFNPSLTVWFTPDPSILPTLLRLQIEQVVSEPDPATGATRYCVMLTTNGVYRSNNQTLVAQTYFSPRAAMCWAATYPSADDICDKLRQIDAAPSEVTHLALYTTMPPQLASEFCRWLTTADNSSPPAAALYYTITFSPNQSNLLLTDGRMLEDGSLAARGIVWKLFKLFKGDENAWWAWLVKGLDIVVDALIGAFLGRQDLALAVDCSAGSGFRAEAMGDFSPEKLQEQQTYTPALELYPRVRLMTAVECMLEDFVQDGDVGQRHTFRFWKNRQRSRSSSALPDPTMEQTGPTPGPSQLPRAPSDADIPSQRQTAQSPSPAQSRRRSRVHRAKHPSPKKGFSRFLTG